MASEITFSPGPERKRGSPIPPGWEELQCKLSAAADISDTNCGFAPQSVVQRCTLDIKMAKHGVQKQRQQEQKARQSLKGERTQAGHGAEAPTTASSSGSSSYAAVLRRGLAERTLSNDATSDASLVTEGREGPHGDQLPLTYIGGLDISFVTDTNFAVASLVILHYPTLAVCRTFMHHCEMKEPYIPGFLAFREFEPLREVIARARHECPELFPQVFMIDGNGVLHPRQCGVATHLGVFLDVTTIGCAKNLHAIDGLQRDDVRAAVAKASNGVHPLVGKSGTMYGYAALTGNSSTNPVFVSPGHRVSMETALKLALSTCVVRVPEPTRQADLQSREYIRVLLAKQQSEQQESNGNRVVA